MEKKYFMSALAPKIKAFIEFKNSLGVEYKTGSRYLLQLDEYNYNNGNSSSLDKEIVEAWIIKHELKCQSQSRSWVSYIREFGKYLQRTGDTNAYILSDNFKINKYRAETYLMNENEVKSFFKKCDEKARKNRKTVHKYVLPAIYRFMYCCGVRTCEARKLKCNEVHLEEKYIDIVLSKTHKDRRLFLSDELSNYLLEYNRHMAESFPNREYFFPNSIGNICHPSIISKNFKKIWVDAGLNYSGKIKPRAYDFRHYFACSNLIRWSKEGHDINSMLPYLMTYMGHVSIESTYYYIHLLPDFFPQYKFLTSKSETLIPEIENEIQ